MKQSQLPDAVRYNASYVCSFVAAVVRSDFAQNRVEMWTTRRLPYEPKGALREARDYLRSELRNLTADGTSLLDARYLSEKTGFVDTENVLLYNVGTSAFAAAARNGLIFKRDFVAPPNAPSEYSDLQHYHLYRLTTKRYGSTNNASVQRFQFGLSFLSFKAYDYWWTAKRILTGTREALSGISGLFTLTITIRGPSHPQNVADMVKPLFDGTISSMHYDPRRLDSHLGCATLAKKLGLASIEIANQLNNPTNAILGPKRLVSGDGRLNPADERCVVGQLLIDDKPGGSCLITADISPYQNAVALAET